ncbi:MAG TPA: hypothetical protein DEQ02_10855 [Ruminococcaceae bacterium]|nr:hypothetical protein [Oscillospiraceae bacterium]
MLSTEVIKRLKQVNISVDSGKTRERTKEIWKAAKAAEKRAVRELADISVNTVYRVISTGSISIKIAAAIGQTLNLNPFYLTGEADERGECSDDLIKKILIKHGYEKGLAGQEKTVKKAKRTAKKQVAPEVAPASDETGAFEEKPPVEVLPVASEDLPFQPEIPDIDLPEVPDEDIMAIIKVLKIKAGLDVQSAKDALRQVYGILLS